MMLSKNHLTIDLVVQAIMIAIFFVTSIFNIEATGLFYMILLFFIGAWQFINGCIGAAFRRNKVRMNYLLYATAFLISIFGMGFVYHYAAIYNHISEIIFFGYIILGGSAFAGWYLHTTWSDYKAYQYTRSFWDLEF